MRYFLSLLLFTPIVSAAEPTPKEVFEKRIVPIFKSPNPSSCAQCHLSGVDLKDYLLGDAEKTFRSMRDQGLVDLTNPEKSKIIRWIDMGGEKAAKGPAALSEKARKAEREAFLEWIKACAADANLKESPKLDAKELAMASKPDEVIRHARKDRLLESFEQNVWAFRFRCMNCHTEGTPQNDKLVKEHGERVAWVRKAGAEATLEYLLQSKLIDTAKPDESLLLTKPLGVVKHGGGIKFQMGDQGYQGFRAWIEDIAAIRTDKYAKASDLPKKKEAPLQFGSDIWLKVTDTPAGWADKLLQVQVFAWDTAGKKWEAQPIATSDRNVFGKGKLWQHNLTWLAAADSERAKAWKKDKPAPAEGKYLLRFYVDRSGKLAKDWKTELGKDEFAGELELQTKWREGYGAMASASAAKLKD